MTHVHEPIAGRVLTWALRYLDTEIVTAAGLASVTYPTLRKIATQEMPTAEGVYLSIGNEVRVDDFTSTCSFMIEVVLSDGGSSRGYLVRDLIVNEFDKYRPGIAGIDTDLRVMFGLRLKSLKRSLLQPCSPYGNQPSANEQIVGTRSIIGYTFKGSRDSNLVTP